MILSQRQLEEIAASTTKDFNRFFFGDEADKPDRSALPTPIDQFAKNYLGLRVSFARLSPDGSICGVTACRAAHSSPISCRNHTSRLFQEVTSLNRRDFCLYIRYNNNRIT